VKEGAPDIFNIRYSPARHGSKIAPEDRVMLLAAETTLVGIGDEAPSKMAAPGRGRDAAKLYGIDGVGGTSVQPLTSQVARAKKGDDRMPCGGTPRPHRLGRRRRRERHQEKIRFAVASLHNVADCISK